MDKTANMGNVYIGDGGENCHLEENAMVFATKEEAQQRIDESNWNELAVVNETDYPVNQ